MRRTPRFGGGEMEGWNFYQPSREHGGRNLVGGPDVLVMLCVICLSGPITSWEIDGETVETVSDFLFWGLQNHCRWWLQPWNKKMLTPWKVMTDLDSILKSRDITLPTKSVYSNLWFFPVVMYGCESWIIKKDEGWRNVAFELRCWRRLLRVPWTGRRSNQSILKETNPGISLEGLMLKLKLQWFGHLMQRVG